MEPKFAEVTLNFLEVVGSVPSVWISLVLDLAQSSVFWFLNLRRSFQGSGGLVPTQVPWGGSGQPGSSHDHDLPEKVCLVEGLAVGPRCNLSLRPSWGRIVGIVNPIDAAIHGCQFVAQVSDPTAKPGLALRLRVAPPPVLLPAPTPVPATEPFWSLGAASAASAGSTGWSSAGGNHGSPT